MTHAHIFFTLCSWLRSGPARVGLKSPRSEKWKNIFSLLSEKWKVNFLAFTFFREVQSEKILISLFFEKWMWKENDSRLRLRIEISREISRNEIFEEFFFFPKSSLKYGLKKCWRRKVDFLFHDHTLLSKKQEDMVEVEWQTEFVFTPFFSREIGVNNTKLSPFFFEKWNGPRTRTRSEICKKNLKNSRETRLSLGTGLD